MSRKEIIATLRTQSGRSVQGGGFSERTDSPFRIDATAWAIPVLKAVGTYLESAGSRLVRQQLFVHG